jgi:hypothetical protein
MVSSLCTSALVISCFLYVSVCVAHRTPKTKQVTQEQTAQLESVSGRITSVQGNTFTLETPQSQNSGAHEFQRDSQKVMTFTVDQNTTVEGKIEVGANADVTYREQDGNDIAVSVRASPPPS